MSGSWERLRSVRASTRVNDRSLSIAVCAPPSRLATLTRAMLRMGSFRPPPEAAPLLQVPHALAVMPLDDGGELEVIGVPFADVGIPMWPLALCRAGVVVNLDAAGVHGGKLEEACALVGVKPLGAADLVPGFSEEDEDHVAALLEAAVNRTRQT